MRLLFSPHTILPLCLILAVSALILWTFLFGTGIDFVALESALQAFKETPYAFFVISAVFSIGAFVMAPQFALYMAVIAIFGPWQGGLYSWGAAMVSGAVTYVFGWVFRLSGRRVSIPGRIKTISAHIATKAFLTSLFVRLLPTGPFLIVNMVFAMSRTPFIKFWAGLGVGMIPKIALIALAGQGVVYAWNGTFVLAGLALFLAGLIWLASRYIKWRQKL